MAKPKRKKPEARILADVPPKVRELIDEVSLATGQNIKVLVAWAIWMSYREYEDLTYGNINLLRRDFKSWLAGEDQPGVPPPETPPKKAKSGKS